MTSVFSELGANTHTMFIELFEFLKDVAFLEECRPFNVGIEVGSTQMKGSSKCTHFVDVGSHAPHAVSDNIDDTHRRLFAMRTDIDNTPLATIFLRRVVDNTNLHLFVNVRSIYPRSHLNFRLCRIIDTSNRLAFCSLCNIHTSRHLPICNLRVVHTGRDLQTIKRIGCYVHNTNLRPRGLVLCNIHS